MDKKSIYTKNVKSCAEVDTDPPQVTVCGHVAATTCATRMVGSLAETPGEKGLSPVSAAVGRVDQTGSPNLRTEIFHYCGAPYGERFDERRHASPREKYARGFRGARTGRSFLPAAQSAGLGLWTLNGLRHDQRGDGVV